MIRLTFCCELVETVCAHAPIRRFLASTGFGIGWIFRVNRVFDLERAVSLLQSGVYYYLTISLDQLVCRRNQLVYLDLQ